jgi:hypothetical protein
LHIGSFQLVAPSLVEPRGRPDGKGGYFITLPHGVVDSLGAMRGQARLRTISVQLRAPSTSGYACAAPGVWACEMMPASKVRRMADADVVRPDKGGRVTAAMPAPGLGEAVTVPAPVPVSAVRPRI